MDNTLLHRPAWFVVGIAIGFVVIALFATINERIGVLGGYSRVLERATGRSSSLGWKAWFLFGVIGGSLVWRLLAGSATVHGGYGWLTRTFGHHAFLPVGGLLLIGGALIGYGAKTAGGCTSGNGIGGCSIGSTSSFAATATFMATAIVASFAIRALI